MESSQSPQSANPQQQFSQVETRNASPTSDIANQNSNAAIPAKFGGDLNKFVEAYNSLEKRLHTSQSQPKAEPQPAPEQASPFASIEARFYENGGKLGDTDRQALINAGFSERFLQAQEKVFQQEVSQLRDTLTKNSGGVNPDDVIKFVNSQIGQKYSYQYADLLNMSIAEGRFGAWNEVVNDYKQSLAGRNPDGADYQMGNVGGFDGFKTTDEIRKAYADPKARRRDGEYMKSLRTRIESTDPNLLDRFHRGL